MFPLHFHYEDVLRQDLLLKENYANVMEVPGLSLIRLVPKASDFRMQFGKLAMEIWCGQRFIQRERGPDVFAGKCFRSNPFLGSEKETGDVIDFARESAVLGHGMSNLLVRILTVMSIFDSPVKIGEKAITFSMEREFCEFSPELEDHFEIFEHMRGFHVTILTSAKRKEETELLWSGFLLKESGESQEDVG
nr:ribosomal protein L5 [Thurnia sphaerocephala]